MNDNIRTLKYVWLDGYDTPNIRTKTKYQKKYYLPKSPVTLDSIPIWSFDGSSTKQAEGKNSDCILKPVNLYEDRSQKNTYIVLCEVYNHDNTPHVTNHRHLIPDNEYSKTFWFGFEQEYTLLDKYGAPLELFDYDDAVYEYNAKPQGEYYCGLGIENVSYRKLVEYHAKRCFDVGIMLTGTNAEVLKGQWEYQVFGIEPKDASDALIISRFLLYEACEAFNVGVTFDPKPLEGDWNGSGLHVNFSNEDMREVGGEDLFVSICEKLGTRHSEHIEVYGEGNDRRLTGNHETQHIDVFSYGISDRGASIRIPITTAQNEWKGYLEDRRPAANANPYLVVCQIIKTLME